MLQTGHKLEENSLLQGYISFIQIGYSGKYYPLTINTLAAYQRKKALYNI
jgi:hypothetical protein